MDGQMNGWMDGWMDGVQVTGDEDHGRPPSPSQLTPNPPSHPPKVDSSAVPLPFCLPRRAACLAHKGATILLVTDFGLSVTVGPGDMLAITVPSSYHNSTCGLCGNFDGRLHNDHHLHRNDVATCHRLCPGPKCSPCRQPPKNEYIHSKLCNILRDPRGPFGVCHEVVRPGIFFDICLWELCESPGDRDALGEVLAAYDAACRQAKIRVGPWRIPRTCPSWCAPGTGCRPGVSCVPHPTLMRRDLSPGEEGFGVGGCG
ncbi:IgGFc-binding protein-like, partial [Meleagris gallopavo]|uniref:IgGFc-binding protein-like n=1 Tax=Meleagris gallopavo TaxID=9103 RepID=UPI0009404EBF